MFLNGGAYISQLFPRLCGGYTYFHTLFSHLNQFVHFGTYITDHKHTGCVGEISFVNGRNIYIDDISALQYLCFAGNTVAYHIIDTGADTFRKSFVVERSGDGTVFCSEVIYHDVDFFGRDPFTDMLRNIIQQGSVDFGTLTDSFQLFGSTQYFARWEFVTLFSVFLYFRFYFSRVIGGSKPESLDKVLHYYRMFFNRTTKVRE